MLQRTLAARFGGMKTNPDVFLSHSDDSKTRAAGKYFGQAVTIGPARPF
jgi:hypothetical protein